MLRIDNNCAMHRAHSWTNDCWANQLIFVLHFDAPCVQCRGVRLQTSWRRSTTQYRAGTVRKLSCCRNTAAWGTMFPKLTSRKPRKENDGRTQVSVIWSNFHCSPVLEWRELWVSLTSYILMEWYSLHVMNPGMAGLAQCPPHRSWSQRGVSLEMCMYPWK